MATIGAAPHLPAGILSPLTGRGALPPTIFANRQRCKTNADVAASLFLPVHGEKCPAGR